MQGSGLAQETSQNALFGMIAQLEKRLVHFVPLKWCKNMVYETSLGNCRKNQSSLLAIT